MTATIVLAGGHGRRMGKRKALLKLGDRTLIERVVETASEFSDEILVVVDKEGRSDLEDLLIGKAKIAYDVTSNGGPLVAIYSGLRRLVSQYSVVLPCDSPFISVDIIKYLIKKAEGADAAVPVWSNGYIEPLHSVYRVEPAQQAAKDACRNAEFRVSSMLHKLRSVIYVAVEDLRAFDGDLSTFFNINSEADLKLAQRLLPRSEFKKYV